ncbi:FAD-dependent oxidoreductase [Paludibacterium yongneupense]|uniref:FAD-dependent oxidoreductase n=1 Tax=Paludibacterium yongneupense TaxID=400061 RepID=UPI000685001D|nr:FAD-dependent oxidoreductase [Paludibacterium yongneupense]
MTAYYDFVVIGGGLAGATAVETLRAEGGEGSILLLCAEAQLPYHRPPLSKSFITASQSPAPPLILEADTYRKLAIDVWLDARVTKVDTGQHTVCTETRGDIRYRQLLIASGASPRHLPLPGADLAGIHYLRTLEDSAAIRQSLGKARRAVVIGGSFIGLEAAASLREKGLAVTLIECDRMLNKLDAPEISAFFEHGFTERGVNVVTGDMPAAFHGHSRVEAVVTRSGASHPCDIVIIGAGVNPETGFLQGSGLDLDDGIRVDRFLQTSQAGVFAAGDVANYFDPVFKRRRRVEHWDHAIKQGRLAARNMLGRRQPYNEVTLFYSEMFDLSFNMLGRFEQGDEKIDRGSLQNLSFASFYLRNDIPQALFSLGRPTEETKVAESLIKNRVNLSARKPQLSDPGNTLRAIPSQTIYILQGGGAFGSFEYGAVKALEEAGIRPDVVAGVSIGAFNSAIIASNPGHAAAALEGFWNELATDSIGLADENLRRMVACGQIALFGVSSFFRPRWLMPALSPEQMPNRWNSLYDTSPAIALLQKYVDFDALKSSPIRLLVSAVDIETSELVVFDSYSDDLTPQHIIASGSLPPGFPWTTIEGRHYWDGGIVSNSPLQGVLERCGSSGKRVFIIDLFPGKRHVLPANLGEVMARQSEILYSERIHSDILRRDLVRDFRKLVEEIAAELPAASLERLRHRPRYVEMMGEDMPLTITRIVREDSEGEPSSKDYDFSRQTLSRLFESGYTTTQQVLQKRMDDAL